MNQTDARRAIRKATRILAFIQLEAETQRMSGFRISKAAALRLVNGRAVNGPLHVSWASDEQTILFIGDKSN